MAQEPQSQPEITTKQLALFQTCHFVHTIFRPSNAFLAKEIPKHILPWVQSLPAEGEDFDPGKFEVILPAEGEDFDPEMFEVIEGGWDHEHCDVCWLTITDGDPYWANERPGDVDLCEPCYERVRLLLGD